jgi:amidohydrolase
MAGNVIPDKVVMHGTLRSFDADTRAQLQTGVVQVAEGIASATGTSAEVMLDPASGYPVTVNDDKLTTEMVGVLRGLLGEEQVYTYPPITGSEDFSFFAEQVPGFYFYLGIAPEDPAQVFANHSPRFTIDERALPIGDRAFVEMTLAYLGARQP